VAEHVIQFCEVKKDQTDWKTNYFWHDHFFKSFLFFRINLCCNQCWFVI